MIGPLRRDLAVKVNECRADCELEDMRCPSWWKTQLRLIASFGIPPRSF
jgi:hypothetical protein